MHERNGMPIEWSFIAFAWGWGYVLGAVVVWGILATLRELVRPKAHPRAGQGERARPYMTPELERMLREESGD